MGLSKIFSYFSQFLPDFSLAANFEKILISPDFPINFKKCHQTSKNYLKSSESYEQKPL